MKKILIAMMVLPSLAFGSVEIHQDEFSLDSATDGSHFWARLYDWNAWDKTDKQKNLKLHTNFVQQAYENGEEEVEIEGPDEDELVTLLGPVEGPALYDFYAIREEIREDEPLDPEDIGAASGLTTVMKVAVDLPDDFDISATNIDIIYKLIAKADQPHIHTEVSKDFVNDFVDPLHSARSTIAKMDAGKIVLSSVNLGFDYYACPSMNTALKFKGGLEGLSTYDGDFRVYLINTLTQVDLSKPYSGQALIEGSPVKVFQQKVIYSSTLIKSGVNFLAFYEMPNGRKKMVLNSVIVSTSKVKEVIGNFVNGISVANIAFSGIKFKDGQAVLSANNTDLSPLDGNCSKGLAQGMARYAMGLADSIVKSSLLIK
jgi:hypothetical protein